MTKLKLNLAQGAGEILTREELKKVLGGTGSGSSGSSGSGSDCPSGTAHCTCNGVYHGCLSLNDCWNKC